MKKHIMSFIALALASTSAFANVPFELSFSDESYRKNAKHIRESRASVPNYAGLDLKIISEEDNLVITNIIVNRGKTCDIRHDKKKFPIKLDYSDSYYWETRCTDRNRFREITIETNKGSWTFKP